ncbi:MAG: heavy metal-binding domain-containing protein [Candidatus Electrothrix scaldis]|nr:MAG: heavy metal-binding domain-containing protein [Candidatus Electrothrix sp. GW3-3]
MDALIQLIFFLTLLTLGYAFGKFAEKRHYRSIMEREKQWMHIPTTTGRRVLGADSKVKNAHLVTGSVVISVDYFKRILAGLRNIFGGNVQSYETLVDRARREAVLRLKESCPEADQIVNLRLETSSISKGKKNQVGSVEVLAYGTAVYLQPATTMDDL